MFLHVCGIFNKFWILCIELFVIKKKRKLSMTFDSSKRPCGTHLCFSHNTSLPFFLSWDVVLLDSINTGLHDKYSEIPQVTTSDGSEEHALVCGLVPGQVESQESERSWLLLSCSRSTLSGRQFTARQHRQAACRLSPMLSLSERTVLFYIIYSIYYIIISILFV